MIGSDERGQASLEYVGVLAVVAVLLAGAVAAIGPPWLGPRMAHAIRHGICVVSGALCTPREAREAGLAACPVRRRSDEERLGAVALIRLERGKGLLVERRSDGTASVSLVDRTRVGAEVGVGVSLPGAAGSAHAGAGVRFAAGRTYDFGSWGAAQRFLVRFAGTATLGAEGRRWLRRLCWRCPEWLEGRDRVLPEPTARYSEGGSFASFAAELGMHASIAAPGRDGSGDVGLDTGANGSVVVGRRTAGAERTWYLRLQADVVARLGAVIGSLDGEAQSDGVLEVTSRDGAPIRARVLASSAMTGAVALAGARSGPAGIAERLRDATAGRDPSGLALEAAVSLDLADPANLRAVQGLLDPGGSPLGRLDRLRALGRRLDVAGAVDLRVLRVVRSADDHTLEAGTLIRIGGGYGRTQEIRELVAAWSIAPGGGLQRRQDCEQAAAGAAA